MQAQGQRLMDLQAADEACRKSSQSENFHDVFIKVFESMSAKVAELQTARRDPNGKGSSRHAACTREGIEDTDVTISRPAQERCRRGLWGSRKLSSCGCTVCS